MPKRSWGRAALAGFLAAGSITGCSGPSEIGADAIDFSEVDLAAGYDYNALVLATQEGAAAFDPRYGLDDLFNPGLQGQFSVKFIF